MEEEEIIMHPSDRKLGIILSWIKELSFFTMSLAILGLLAMLVNSGVYTIGSKACTIIAVISFIIWNIVRVFLEYWSPRMVRVVYTDEPTSQE